MPGSETSIPAILVFAGLDPTGGAGLQADIEAISSSGGHALPIATALTAQDTHDVRSIHPVAPELLMEQARALLADVTPRAVKIGLLGSLEALEVIREVLAGLPDIPVVLDPVGASGAGRSMADRSTLDAITTRLCPFVTVLTPNANEASLLVPDAESPDAAARALVRHGCDHVLLTGGDASTTAVENVLHGPGGEITAYQWRRLDGSFHGSGCTLAASLSAYLGRGLAVADAVSKAQDFAWQSLAQGFPIGSGQLIPDRHFRTRGGATIPR